MSPALFIGTDKKLPNTFLAAKKRVIYKEDIIQIVRLREVNDLAAFYGIGEFGCCVDSMWVPFIAPLIKYTETGQVESYKAGRSLVRWVNKLLIGLRDNGFQISLMLASCSTQNVEKIRSEEPRLLNFSQLMDERLVFEYQVRYRLQM